MPTFSLRTLVAQAFRNPSIAERFIKFEQGGGLRFEPNPGLKAEKLVFSYELGVNWKVLRNLSFDAAYYLNRYRDLISYEQVAQPGGELVYRVVNLNKAIMQGVEINADYKWSPYLHFRLGYTYLDARDDSEDRVNDNLAYKSKHTVTGSVMANYQRWSLTLTGRYRSRIDEVFIYPGSEPDAFSVFNSRLQFQVTDALLVYLAADNLADTQYEEIERYRMPGRNYTVGVRVGL